MCWTLNGPGALSKRNRIAFEARNLSGRCRDVFQMQVKAAVC
jgi:hypothetical protein